MKIAIVGSGITGMGVAYMLQPHHPITLYEANETLGGHSRTIFVKTLTGQIPVDTGFIVYNRENYPNLTALFNHLGVSVQKSEMSFGVSIQKGWLEYSSKNILAQKSNIFRPQFLRMLIDILHFNTKALDVLGQNPNVSLGEFLKIIRSGEWFQDYYLLAMGAAIWSCSVETIMDFPARVFLRFFENHGLLTVNQQPQWYTVKGGSREYIKKLTASFADSVRVACAIQHVVRSSYGVEILDSTGNSETYDKVIFACHADQALSLLRTPTEEEKLVLGAFSYQKNEVVTHSDLSFMPRERNRWASWVYLSDTVADTKPCVSLSYWMNNLQNLPKDPPIIVTLNPGREPKPELTYDRIVFDHPVFNENAIKAQAKMPDLQGHNNTYYCGAYQRYGFHEDGLLSAVNVAAVLGIKPPWN